MIEILKPEFNYKSKITKTFENLMNTYAELIIQNTETDYQLNITTVLSILEMCIRIIFISNTKGIFKALPDYSEIVINNEANKFGDLVEDKFTKDIKKFYKQIIVKFSELKQKRDSEALIYSRTKASVQSLTKPLERNLGQIANESNNESNINEVGTPVVGTPMVGTPILETDPSSINEGKEVSGLFFSSSENSPLKNDEIFIPTQIDDDNDNIERLKIEINDLYQEKQILQNKITDLENELKRCEQALQYININTKELLQEEERKRNELKSSIFDLSEKFNKCKEKNKKLGEELERCKQENERLKHQSENVFSLAPPFSPSSATPLESESSSVETNPPKSYKKDTSSSPRRSPRNFPRLRNDSSLSSLPTNVQQELGPRSRIPTISSSLKRKQQPPQPKNGGTFKQYQNKYKFSIKNRPHLKNKSIKHNKRKHNKTYKRK